MKKLVIITSALLLITIIPILFVYQTFSESYDCDQLVIDTYELHSRINIPEVEYVNCYFDKELNTRISVYDLKNAMDLDRFKLVESSFADHLVGSSLLANEEQPKESNIYLLSGERFGTTWTYAVDQESNRLWAELNY